MRASGLVSVCVSMRSVPSSRSKIHETSWEEKGIRLLQKLRATATLQDEVPADPADARLDIVC